ncbi:TPA_asm: hypothetical protein [Altiarchaeum virus]|nr:MAG: hypothetical protein BWK75_06345 [Candidatus Altiarchaeales archaeon A3]DAZ85570.1 TPA_asm: hypothetical protein [Altiarchaeum virus]
MCKSKINKMNGEKIYVITETELTKRKKDIENNSFVKCINIERDQKGIYGIFIKIMDYDEK